MRVVSKGNVKATGIGRPDYSGPAISNRTTGLTGTVTVAAAGTPVQLPDISIPDGFAVTLVPLPGNAGLVYTQYLSGATATARMPLDNGQPIAFPVKNLNVIYLDADNAGDGATWTVVQ